MEHYSLTIATKCKGKGKGSGSGGSSGGGDEDHSEGAEESTGGFFADILNSIL